MAAPLPARRLERPLPPRREPVVARAPRAPAPVGSGPAPAEHAAAEEHAPEPITVSIGRVEIRAAGPPAAPAAAIREPRQSLDDFLRSREGGR